MTAASLTNLPLAAGSILLSTISRAAVWAASRFMRAPLANTGVLALVGFTVIAGSNALYLQQHAHPSPLFGGAVAPKAEVEPVVPAVRTKQPAAALKVDIPAEVSAADKPIDNADVRELQRKLEMLQFFDGTVDGLYGPRTARAIKRFEEENGLKVRGELTREILDIVARASLSSAKPVVEPLPAADPLPTVKVKPIAVPVTEPSTVKPQATVEPLEAPEPLRLAAVEEKKPLTRELPSTPEEAFDIAVETAGDAIDTIISGVQTVAMKRPAKKPVVVNQFVADGSDKPVEVAELPVTKDPVPEMPAKIAMVSAEVTGSVPAKATLIAPDAVEDEVVAMSSDDVPELDTDAKPEDLMPAFSVTDPVIVARVQRGLASLGFLHGQIDGVAGEATAKAIRNFEVYYNYKVTGRISPELPDLLVENGASI